MTTRDFGSPILPKPGPPRKGEGRGLELRAALVITVAALSAFLAVWGAAARLGLGPGVAIMAAVLTVTLARRPDSREHRHLAIEAGGMLVVALAATALGEILRSDLPLGGVLFSAALAASVWLRGLGDDARVIGRAIALPFIAILVVPVPRPSDAGQGAFIAGAVLLALLLATLAQRLLASTESAEPTTQRAPSSLVPPSHVRMALQLGVSLLAAFAIGAALFPTHWAWIVLTAFIVCNGARGRSDALYKGVLRLVGALAGGILIAALAAPLPRSGSLDAALIFVALFAGVALRGRSYAYWAASTTLIFALLMRIEASFTLHDYLLRTICIVIGAACAIASCWWIYPIRTRDIVRRRVAAMLARFERIDDVGLDAAHAVAARDARDVLALAPALEFHRTISRRAADADHPALWLRVVSDAFSEPPRADADPVRIAQLARQARRAIRDDDAVTQALQRVCSALRD